MIELGIPVEEAYIFGSRSRGDEHKGSDLDTCIVSPVFGVDTIADSIVLTRVGRTIDSLIEPHPISPVDFMSKYNVMANEIRAHGVRVL